MAKEKKSLDTEKPILVASNSEFTKEKAQELAEVSGSAVVLVNDIESVKMLQPEVLTGFALFKKLKGVNFPQGGQGHFIIDPETDERVYVPRPEELYAQFIGDPTHWDALRDNLARTWIERNQ